MSYVTDLPASAKLLYKPNARILGEQAQIGNSGYGAEMGWVCDYDDQDAFLETVIGTYENVGNGVTRLVPLRHPTYSNMLATSFTAEGFGHDSTKTASPFGYQYLKSRILVTFHIPPWPIIGSSAFQTIRLRHGAMGLSIPDNGYKFPGSGKRISGVDAATLIPTITYSITYFNCPTLNDDLVKLASASPVSSAPFMNEAAGLFRFDGADIDMTQLTNGQIVYQKTFNFTWRAVDWNAILNESGAWEKPVKTSDGTYIYATYDLNNLTNV